MLGDVNGDGNIDAIDIAVLKKYLLDTVGEIDKLAADINKDGYIDAIDFAVLKQLLLGI